MALHSNSTFLPVLDDLLSPEFRPILQTPTVSKNFIGLQQDAQFTNGHSSSRQNGQAGDPDHLAARKIQNWWKSHSKTGLGCDPVAERAKHSIRHRRTEEHVTNLESQVALLKNALQSERKLRSLQLEAIRSLWSQVQRISAPAAGSESLMSQSMPNGLIAVNNSPAKKNQMSSSCYAEVQGGQGQDVQPTQTSTCTSNCAKEIENLKQTLQIEMNGLREMIARLTKDKDPPVNPVGDKAPAPEGGKDTSTAGADPEPDTADNSISTTSSASPASQSQPQRPASLNLKQTESDTPKEVDGFANEMAAKVLFDAATLDEDC